MLPAKKAAALKAVAAAAKEVGGGGGGGGGRGAGQGGDSKVRQMTPELIAKTANHKKIKGEVSLA